MIEGMNAIGHQDKLRAEKQAYAVGMLQANPEKLTLRENIENRISFHKREIASLEAALKNITEKPLSEITIGDLNIAMRY